MAKNPAVVHSEAPIHDFFPEVFKQHIDGGKGVFRVTQEMKGIDRPKGAVIKLDDPLFGRETCLSIGDEIVLQGGCARMKVNDDSSNVRSVVTLYAKRRTGSNIDVVVKGIDDITDYLCPIESFSKAQVETKNDIDNILSGKAGLEWILERLAKSNLPSYISEIYNRIDAQWCKDGIRDEILESGGAEYIEEDNFNNIVNHIKRYIGYFLSI